MNEIRIRDDRIDIYYNKTLIQLCYNGEIQTISDKHHNGYFDAFICGGQFRYNYSDIDVKMDQWQIAYSGEITRRSKKSYESKLIYITFHGFEIDYKNCFIHNYKQNIWMEYNGNWNKWVK